MRLEFGVELVLARLFRLITFEEDDTPAFVAGGKVVSRLIEFDGRDDVGFCDVLDVAFIAKAPATTASVSLFGLGFSLNLINLGPKRSHCVKCHTCSATGRLL